MYWFSAEFSGASMTMVFPFSRVKVILLNSERPERTGPIRDKRHKSESAENVPGRCLSIVLITAVTIGSRIVHAVSRSPPNIALSRAHRHTCKDRSCVEEVDRHVHNCLAPCSPSFRGSPVCNMKHRTWEEPQYRIQHLRKLFSFHPSGLPVPEYRGNTDQV